MNFCGSWVHEWWWTSDAQRVVTGEQWQCGDAVERELERGASEMEADWAVANCSRSQKVSIGTWMGKK